MPDPEDGQQDNIHCNPVLGRAVRGIRQPMHVLDVHGNEDTSGQCPRILYRGSLLQRLRVSVLQESFEMRSGELDTGRKRAIPVRIYFAEFHNGREEARSRTEPEWKTHLAPFR